MCATFVGVGAAACYIPMMRGYRNGTGPSPPRAVSIAFLLVSLIHLSQNGVTALMYACEWKTETAAKVVYTLLGAGADKDAKAKVGAG